MFTSIAHQGVDTIQGAKKQFITTFVQNEQFAKVLNGFVDAQASYTKAAIDAGIKASAGTVEILTDRTPYVELAEKIAQYFPTNTKTTKKAK